MVYNETTTVEAVIVYTQEAEAPMRSKFTPEERFWSKVDTDGPAPSYAPHLGQCWVWIGSLNRGGYGCGFAVGSMTDGTRKTMLAHRWIYEHEVGLIPTGLVIDHLCRTRACVRTKHMEAVTLRENILRGFGRDAAEARQTECLRGHPFSEENTYRHPAGRRVCRICKRASYAK